MFKRTPRVKCIHPLSTHTLKKNSVYYTDSRVRTKSGVKHWILPHFMILNSSVFYPVQFSTLCVLHEAFLNTADSHCWTLVYYMSIHWMKMNVFRKNRFHQNRKCLPHSQTLRPFKNEHLNRSSPERKPIYYSYLSFIVLQIHTTPQA